LGSLKKEPAVPYELDIEFLKWYVEEIYALAEKYKKTFPRIRYFEITLSDLNDIDKVKGMFAYFGLTPMDSLSDTVGKATNLKNHIK
jgi:hypothetical protein